MVKKILPLAVCALALAGCSNAKTNDSAATPVPATTATTSEATSTKPTVLVSLYPIEYIVRQIGGDDVNVKSLAPAGVEPHDLELSPKEVAEVPQADLVVYLKGFQAAVDKAVEQGSPKDALNIYDFANIKPAKPGQHDDDHDHEHLAFDPHFWLNPSNMASVGDAVASELKKIAPAKAEAFQQRNSEFQAKMLGLTKDAIDSLSNCKHDTFITTHEAFAYLARLTNTKQQGLSGLDPESAPSPARLAEISKVVKEKGINTIFTEDLVSPKVAQTLSKDLGVKTEVLSPIESQTDASKDYADMFSGDIKQLHTALECQ